MARNKSSKQIYLISILVTTIVVLVVVIVSSNYNSSNSSNLAIPNKDKHAGVAVDSSQHNTNDSINGTSTAISSSEDNNSVPANDQQSKHQKATNTDIVNALAVAWKMGNSPDGSIRTRAMSEYNAIRNKRGDFQEAFREYDAKIIQSLKRLIVSKKVEDQQKAFHLLYLLDREPALNNLSFLIENLKFRNPYVRVYHSGPSSYTEPRTGDLPIVGKFLMRLGPEVIEPLFDHALLANDQITHEAIGGVLLANYKFNGALKYLDNAVERDGLSTDKIDRIKSIRKYIESIR